MSKTVTAGSVSGLDFQYHMYGGTMGTATLEAYTGTSWISAWTKSGNLGNAWMQASVAVASGATMLRFKYTGASSYSGDFALDDIQAASRSCLFICLSVCPSVYFSIRTVCHRPYPPVLHLPFLP